jgi:6,7-dimethyl-8-ribityllumazine synthase
MKTYEGKYDATGLRLAIVVARFNETITSQLLVGTLDGLMRHGVAETDIEVAHVPGSFELPFVAYQFAKTGRFDAIICLGCVIRGETAHFDYVAGEAASGIARVALETGVPVIFGVLTTDNLEQALLRSGIKGGNRGFDAALAAIEMADLKRKISEA